MGSCASTIPDSSETNFSQENYSRHASLKVFSWMVRDLIFSQLTPIEFQQPQSRCLKTLQPVPHKKVCSLIGRHDLKEAMRKSRKHRLYRSDKKMGWLWQWICWPNQEKVSMLVGCPNFFHLVSLFGRTFVLRAQSLLSSSPVSVASATWRTVWDGPCCNLSSISSSSGNTI